MNRFQALSAKLFLVLFLHFFTASAQQTSIYTDPDKEYKLALELYNKQKFAAARKFFERSIDHNINAHSEILANSQFYAALCAVELFHKNAEDKLLAFISRYPENPKINLAYLNLGNYQYRRKKFKEAAEAYEMVDLYGISQEELAEYYFKLGYSYFETEKLEEAAKNFFEIKDVDTRYTTPAQYYYSHISYNKRNYETALSGFLKLTKDATFGPIVPYYIAQIYFLQGRYDEVIAYAPPLLDTANVKRAPEITRIIGESYYNNQDFENAIPFLEKYKKATGRLTREDAYQLGYAYLRTNNNQKAIEYYQQVTRENDLIAQIAFYQTAAAYLKADNKNFARNSFRSAYKMDFDKAIQEDAHFNYAKLSYELANNPFHEAIEAFQSYIETYPETDRADEAYKYLLNVFLTTRNFKDALTAIEKIGKKTKDLEYAYQKVAFYRGVDLYNTGSYVAAISHFEKSLTFPLDRSLNAQANYWKAEALFNLRKFDEAISSYQVFMNEPGAAALPEFFTANYNIGYAHFKTRAYPSAIQAFRKYAGVQPAEDMKKLNDALLRIADSYFITKDYDNASDYYGQAANIRMLQTDYALYQKAICFGLIGKHQQKLPLLEKVIQEYPGSIYAIDSKFEIGKTYQLLGDNQNALKYFQRIVNEHPESAVVSKALVQQGLIFYNQNKDEEALNIYKKVIRDFPGSAESHQALLGLKNIYISSGRPDEYSTFVEGLPFANVTKASLDSAHYESAEGLYLKGECEGALKNFESYLQKFPDGIFTLHVNYYKSDCYHKAKDFDNALVGYKYVTDKPKNIFTEKSLARSAAIYYNRKQFEEAMEAYSRLEKQSEFPANLLDARIGLMRTNYNLNNLNAAKEWADKVSVMENVSAQINNEINLIQGKYLLEQSQYAQALSKFSTVAGNAKATSIGAEAKYLAAYAKFLLQNFADAEKEIFDLSEKFSAFDFWVAKGFILLADVYTAQNDNFQAKHTLKSIIDNYEGEDLKNIARQKLQKIEEEEQPQQQRKEPEQIEIDIDRSEEDGYQEEE
jgi:tetratricopeptide (TPR) repeat protein